MQTLLTEDQWLQYVRDGYLMLGQVASDEQLATLQTRIDDIMLGKADLDYDRMLMQLDSETGAYDNAGAQTKGHKGATLNYRKIQDLEFDPFFLRYMQHTLFHEICVRHYGSHVPVGCFRAMFMNKPAQRGTYLPWHQDRWNNLDRDPLVTIWTALDPVTAANGAVQVIPGSHRFGVLNPAHGSGFLTPEMAEKACPKDQAITLELKAGEVCLLHNWLLHSSDVNRTNTPRRGFSVCYLDARTRTTTGENPGFPVIFGKGQLNPENLQPASVA